jgi:hypothetical protein
MGTSKVYYELTLCNAQRTVRQELGALMESYTEKGRPIWLE